MAYQVLKFDLSNLHSLLHSLYTLSTPSRWALIREQRALSLEYLDSSESSLFFQLGREPACRNGIISLVLKHFQDRK